MNSQYDDDKRNISHFTHLAERHGVSFRSVDWGSKESQELRFSIFAQAGNLNGRTILDVGCGMGDFYNWLNQTGIKADYTGVDITPKMIEIAKQRFPGVCFEINNLLDLTSNKIEPGQYDYVFASGIFCYREHEPFEFMKNMVENMFKISKKTLTFNSLSLMAPDKERKEFYADPVKIVSFCQTLTPWIIFRHDYHPRDFTVYMYKE